MRSDVFGIPGFDRGRERSLAGKGALHSWTCGVNGFVQMDFNNSIVIDIQGVANRILRDFQPSIDVPSQSRPEKKFDREIQCMSL